jgi:D-alanyl-D-alanine carboxypeptidase
MMYQASFIDGIEAIHRELNIPPDYATSRFLELQIEPPTLVDIGKDIFDRPQWLTPEAAEHWSKMRRAADAEGISLLVVSAFRSVEYQREIFRRKLTQGQCLAEILAVNAAPGYSEHHTGRALDLTVAGCEPLCEAFEQTPAFTWLTGNALGFNFSLSLPRNNPHGFVYEPWHWVYGG